MDGALVLVCEHCGGRFERRKCRGRPRRYCTHSCTVAANLARARVAGVCADCGAVISRGCERCRGCATRIKLADEAARLAGQRRPCKQCGVEFAPSREQSRYCSDRCQNRYRHLNRTRKDAYRGELINLADVFKRDAGECQLCGAPVDLSIRWPDPMSASLDHVVPMSQGGPHTLTNVQLAHLGCNSRKRDRTEQECPATA